MEDTLQEGNQSQSTLLGEQVLKSPGRGGCLTQSNSGYLHGFLALGGDNDSLKGSMGQTEQFLHWEQANKIR